MLSFKVNVSVSCRIGRNATPVLATYKVMRSVVHEAMRFSVYEVPRFHTILQEQKYPKALFCTLGIHL